ncbi:hypothetical protein CDCA_CDCA16G4191 [Cyanidium caldarium]|uniref:Centrosomal protein of 162 kDa n=1 Tax=Cyanidium caldarium TaxID=2771 RepID=A0AAV9J1L8_CYACA|nr:hypothetical protein CDCA_CDCA16G4191 [Cyanidium caldarium]
MSAPAQPVPTSALAALDATLQQLRDDGWVVLQRNALERALRARLLSVEQAAEQRLLFAERQLCLLERRLVDARQAAARAAQNTPQQETSAHADHRSNEWEAQWMEQRAARSALERELADSRAAVTALQEQVERLQQQVADSVRQLSRARESNARTESELRGQVEALEKENENLVQRSVEERSQLRQLREDRRQLEQQFADEAQRAERQTTALRDLQQQCEQGRQALEHAEQERDALRKRCAQLETDAASNARAPSALPVADAEVGAKRRRRSMFASPAQRVAVEVEPLRGHASPAHATVRRRLIRTPGETPLASADGKSVAAAPSPLPPEAAERRAERAAHHADFLQRILAEWEAQAPLLEHQRRRFQFAISQFDRLSVALRERELECEQLRRQMVAAEHHHHDLQRSLERATLQKAKADERIEYLSQVVATFEKAGALPPPEQAALSAQQLQHVEQEIARIRDQRQQFEEMMETVVRQRDLYRELLMKRMRGEDASGQAEGVSG